MKRKNTLSKPLNPYVAIIKDAWAILVQKAKADKAMRILNKQEWSVEFLISLLQRADRNVGFTFSQNGRSFTITKDIKQKGDLTEQDLMDYLGIGVPHVVL